ncbi:hypothetical protein [Alteribacter populi]|nr:hypothetical protein [Alteribacter populi]
MKRFVCLLFISCSLGLVAVINPVPTFDLFAEDHPEPTSGEKNN